MDYLKQQEEKYKEIQARAENSWGMLQSQGPTTNLTKGNYNLAVLLRPSEPVQDVIISLQAHIVQILGQDILYCLDKPSLHACLANTGSNQAYQHRQSPEVKEKLGDISAVVHDLLKNYNHPYGEISYPTDRKDRPSPLIFAPDSALIAGQPDELALHTTKGLHDALKTEKTKKLWKVFLDTCGMWGFHSTITRTLKNVTIEDKAQAELKKFIEKAKIPSWTADTVDVIHVINSVSSHEGKLTVDLQTREPYERFNYDNLKKSWAIAP